MTLCESVVVGLYCIVTLQYLLRVPIFKEERFPYEPAISSSSIPYEPKHNINIVRHMGGQRLYGDMVMYRESSCDDSEVDK